MGIQVNVSHLAATTLGRKVTARAELVEVGEGQHQRFIVDAARFMQKAATR